MKPYSLITGGVGFIGTNLAHHYLAQGEAAQAVFHFAAHVTVTSSLQEPLADFAVNTQAILDLLEALRQTNPTTPLVFTSTNKVYEELAALPLIQQSSHYAPLELFDATAGISKQQAFDFHSPCGCFKGATDQYVLDCRLPLLPKLAVRGVFLPVRRGRPSAPTALPNYLNPRALWPKHRAQLAASSHVSWSIVTEISPIPRVLSSTETQNYHLHLFSSRLREELLVGRQK